MKKKKTIERDKYGRRTNQETLDAGYSAVKSVRLTAEEIIELESYANMRDVTFSDAMRMKMFRNAGDDERVVEHLRKFYYGLRETGVEQLGSGRAAREAYEEYARAAHVVRVAIDRVGVNINQIAKQVNSGNVDPGNADAWLAELVACRVALEAIAERGHVDDVRPIPPLDTDSTNGSDASGTTARDNTANAVSAAEHDASADAAPAVAEHPETKPETKPGKRPKPVAKTKPETTAETEPETEQKKKRKPTAKPVPETAAEPKSEPKPEPKPEPERDVDTGAVSGMKWKGMDDAMRILGKSGTKRWAQSYTKGKGGE
ncbi:Bacterial mobilisation protein (MobC) [Slackia heliotrinireducens]|uniref:Bacterial mobilisation protein (MobC) n=1 Tax=Slackia heliotrinireducens (strain ATCC 29202 / DSM 20476 / NCTC 11029 / RHS 1) TaxID=471855 RepID=C7N833_SLAHD|nr:MobC family plasmid mobilization relaxosome protein [Slackia heliotrinireducens]ACV23068.1 Bacterial mobilisation protein (MobC) [Slackia heliotrinireducens DSM 20476]VEH02027.1 Bacterial mobilisation protein (MobC) [Slackia heliotrinireducens]